jgi:two-component system cell cycle sensor histidine kinase/response regulator CckA
VSPPKPKHDSRLRPDAGRRATARDITGATGKPVRTRAHRAAAADTPEALIERISETAGPEADSRQLMRSALEELQRWTGCEAGAIRPEEGGDYPYVVAHGFPTHYLGTDNSLFSHSPDGTLLCDEHGRPLLECACGSIIRGDHPVQHPSFTRAGTYWTGSTSDRADEVGEAGGFLPLRGRCAAGGYESVACIPLRLEDRVFGILQLKSKRKHRITPEVLSVLEPAVSAFAVMLRNKMAQEALANQETAYAALLSTIREAFAFCRIVHDKHGQPCDFVFMKVNNAFEQLFDVSEPLGRTIGEVDPRICKGRPAASEVWTRVAKTGIAEASAEHYPHLGKQLNMRVSRPAQDHLLAVFEDMTEQTQVEERLRLVQYSLEHVRDYLTWIDREGRIVEVSDPTCRVLEYSRDELLAMSVFDIDPILSQKFWRNNWNQTKKRGTYFIESEHRTKSGRVFPVEIAATYLVFGGHEYHCGFCRDISERKRMEQVLNDEIARRQLLVAQSSDGIVVLDQDGAVVEANEEYARQLGYPVEEVLGLHIWDWQIDYSKEELLEFIGRVDTTGDHFDTRHRRKDGTFFDVDISSSGSIIGDRKYVFCVCRDVTERRRVEESLRLTQFSVDHAPDLIHWVDADGRITYANRATCELLGYSQEELQHMCVWDVSPNLTPEAFRNRWTDMTAGKARLIEDTLKAKDGSEIVAELALARFEHDGREVGVAFIRDITDRKEAAEKLEESRQMLRRILDTVPLRIGWRDRELRYLGCNAALADDADLPGPEAIVGLKEEDLPVFNATQACHDDDLEVMETGKPKLHYQETVINSRGETRVLLSSKVPLYDRSGRVSGILGIYEDVTDHAGTLKALQEREEQLRQSQKMEAVGRLAGGIAHDFNNVLTTIMGYSDLILSSPDCPAGSLAEDVREIKAAAERAGGLTRRILAFSRRQALQPTVLSLNTVVSDTEQLLSRTLGADVELYTSLSPDLGAVEIDEQQFVQVLLNLAVNARDAMPRGGVLTLETANVELDEYFCKTHPDAHPGSYVVLNVADTGIGMDEETLAHVFEPFYTTKPPGEGTGLGLSTVYGLVAQSGGYTYVRSQPGQGTTFSIYLPRVAKDAVPEERETGVPPREKVRRVMIVEDDAAYMTLAKRILERRGFDVHPVGDGEQALLALGDPSLEVDILLTDIALPGSLQGDELARSATTARPGLPILFMSALARDAMIQVGRVEEQVGYLEKPFTAEELISLVRAALGDDKPADQRSKRHPRTEAAT